ncbi:MAG: hypothetical protein ACK41D_10225 [Rubricoccaceae bacterium]
MADRPTPVTGSFRDAESADRAYAAFRERGYSDDEIHVLMSDDTRKRYYDREHVEIEKGNKAMEGAGTGAAVGGTIGGIVGAIAALGTTALIPPLGLTVAGPLVGALAGAGAGGAAGTLVGGLIGAGIPEQRAKEYEKDIKDGHIVVGVHPRDDEDRRYFAERYNEYGARNVYAGERIA